ncbi:hypothetical protein C1645_834086 [Glomus cerebriforme]|uniref:Uncharacterized protein n=1 Tax=Glomus cerebriforme TaxID=658196 RepID=A0A397SEF7_9GLOM|nr:hypothetical protein C1645_834086 [Glomus cerebriforme]
MVDFNTLNIDEIKRQKFGGKDLTDEEKVAFFDHSLVSSDVTKARQVAVFLLSVKEALTKTSADASLLGTLKGKDKNSLEYKVVNSHNNLVESAITHLKSKGGNPDEKRGEIKELKEELDKYKKITGQKGVEFYKAKKHREDVNKVLNLVKNDTSANRILQNIVDRTSEHIINNNISDSILETTITKPVFFCPNGTVYNGIENLNKDEDKVVNDLNSVFFKDLNNRGTGENKFPYLKPELSDIAIIMEEVFPENGLKNNPILTSGDNDLRVNENPEIYYVGFKKNLTSGKYLNMSLIQEELTNDDLKLVSVYPSVKSETGLFKMF